MSLRRMFLMYLGGFMAMFITMYAMVAEWSHVYLNINKGYMALLMVAAMGIVNGVVMAGMYASSRLRYGLLGASLIVLVLVFYVIRVQGLVGNKSFLQSMIPHHSSAILMCNQAQITDAEIASLCDGIVQTQREEIRIMEDILRRKYE